MLPTQNSLPTIARAQSRFFINPHQAAAIVFHAHVEHKAIV
jgi:hypothetical protein